MASKSNDLRRRSWIFALEAEKLDSLAGVCLSTRDKTWLVDPKIWWRHPTARIFVAFVILALDFYIFGEDPQNESHVEYTFYGIGHLYSLLLIWPEELYLRILRVAIIAILSLLSMYVSRQWLHHCLLRDYLGLTMFKENKGGFFVMLLSEGLVLMYICPFAYNLCVSGSFDEPLSARTFHPFRWWGNIWQYISVPLDILTIMSVIDMVLQDRHLYPNWARGTKKLWTQSCGGWFRVLAAWGLGSSSVAFACWAIYHSGRCGGVFYWDNRVIGGTTVVMRVLLASICAICDILNLVQDWEFPSFDQEFEIYITGTFLDTLSCSALSWLVRWLCRVCTCFPEELSEVFRLQMSGKWVAYMSVWGSLLADLSCLRSQFCYSPEHYGQFVDPVTQRIWNIVDDHYLQLAYQAGELVRPELVTWAARHPGHPAFNATSAATDVELNSRFSKTGLRWIALVPGSLAILAFALLVTGAERHWSSFEQSLKAAGSEAAQALQLMLDHIPTRSLQTATARSFQTRAASQVLKRRCGKRVFGFASAVVAALLSFRVRHAQPPNSQISLVQVRAPQKQRIQGYEARAKAKYLRDSALYA